MYFFLFPFLSGFLPPSPFLSFFFLSFLLPYFSSFLSCFLVFFLSLFLLLRMKCMRALLKIRNLRIAAFVSHYMATDLHEKSWASSTCIKSSITPVDIILYLENNFFENSKFILEDCFADSSNGRINLVFIVPFTSFSTGACAAFSVSQHPKWLNRQSLDMEWDAYKMSWGTVSG